MLYKISEILEELKPELLQLSNYIWNNPELGSEEYKACTAHMELLKKHGFEVEEAFLGIETAFRAVYRSRKPGPVIAFLSEYDALPEIGHGCGHNLIGTVSTGAGIVLSKLINDLCGEVVVFGTPAEETNGAKVEMSDRGAFDNVDIALMAHPADKFYSSSPSLALEPLRFTFRGRTAHAAASPEKGINALDAVINTFVNINTLRQYILPTARVHGIIKEGGKAPNIIPDLAIAEFYVRAEKKQYLKELVEKVKNCARAAALASGAELEIENHQCPFDDLVTNRTLSEIFDKNLLDTGIENIEGVKLGTGSLDAGNVSYIVPTIHPWFGICDREIPLHTKEFAEAAASPYAHEMMLKTIEALVLTAAEVIKEEELLGRIREEFTREVRGRS